MGKDPGFHRLHGDPGAFIVAETHPDLVFFHHRHVSRIGPLGGSDARQNGGEAVVPGGVQQARATGDGAVDYINAHGTSTPAGDIQELKAVKEAYAGQDLPTVGSTKSLSGHSLGAAGVQEAIYSLLMMEDDFVAASANIENLDPEAEGMPVALERVDNAGLTRVMSNSFGFGGTNASLVFQRLS